MSTWMIKYAGTYMSVEEFNKITKDFCSSLYHAEHVDILELCVVLFNSLVLSCAVYNAMYTL